jgi:hypothetical protein
MVFIFTAERTSKSEAYMMTIHETSMNDVFDGGLQVPAIGEVER